MRLNDISYIMGAIKQDMDRSTALSLRMCCESFLTKLSTEQFSDIMWIGSWGLGDDYFWDVVNSMDEEEMYILMKENRWKMQ